MTCAVVTPWVNHLELYDEYIHAMQLGPMPDELLIVDNASDPPLPFAAFYLDRNFGFSGGSNAGLQKATADAVVFLNNDIMATREGWLDDLVNAIEPGVLVGARLRNEGHGDVDGMRMPYLDGWCLGGLREEFLALGGWDESLQEPSYYGDNLLCLEARAQGFTLREVQTGLMHKGGMTTMANGHLMPSTVANKVVYENRVRELVAHE